MRCGAPHAAVLLLAGCVQVPLLPGGEDIHWAYGNFCGGAYPRLAATTTAAMRAELESIEPADDIDAACRRHDLCYLERGMHDFRCDDERIEAMVRIRFTGPDRRACANVANQIAKFFAGAMPSRGDGLEGLLGALKPITQAHPLCPGFASADLVAALGGAPAPGRCMGRRN